MKREYKLFLGDILESIERVQKYTSTLTLSSFKNNSLVRDACVRNIEIMGEAIKNIPKEVKARYPDIPWEKVIGFRNMVIHQYWVIDVDILWDIIQTKLDSLYKQVAVALEKEKNLK